MQACASFVPILTLVLLITLLQSPRRGTQPPWQTSTSTIPKYVLLLLTLRPTSASRSPTHQRPNDDNFQTEDCITLLALLACASATGTSCSGSQLKFSTPKNLNPGNQHLTKTHRSLRQPQLGWRHHNPNGKNLEKPGGRQTSLPQLL